MKLDTPSLYDLYLKHPIVCTDTRSISVGCLFFALKGERFDGNTFVAEAIRQGAAYAITDDPANEPIAQCVLVGDVLTALQDLARYHRQQFSIPVIGITGSNGKTTTKELVYSVLKQSYKTHYTKGNLNNHIGVPLSLLSMPKSTEVAVIEMGANHPLEIKTLCEIALPTHGIITNVGHAHLEGFGSFEGVKKTKKELYDFLQSHNGTAFIHGNNPHLMLMASSLKNKILYGSDPSFSVSAQLMKSDECIELLWCSGEDARTRDPGEDARTNAVHSVLRGRYNYENILAAICIGYELGVSTEKIARGIGEYTPSNNRSQMVSKGSNAILLDAYNANPTSVKAAIEYFGSLKGKKRVVILGDMFELGDYSDEAHREVIKQLSAYAFDEVVLVGERFRKNAPAAGVISFDTTEAAAEWLKQKQYADTFFLIKGSRKMQLEKLAELIF